MSKIFTFATANANGPNTESLPVQNNLRYFVFQSGHFNYDKGNINSFKQYMKMTDKEGKYDIVAEETGAKAKKSGIIFDKGQEFIKSNNRAAKFFLSLLHGLVWKSGVNKRTNTPFDPVTYDAFGNPTNAALVWNRAVQSSMDIEDAMMILEPLIREYIKVQELLIENKFGANLNAAVVNNKLNEIEEKAKFNLDPFH